MNELTALGQYCVNGLYLSSYYGLLVLGISLVFGIMKIGDVAQGGLFVLGSYLSFVVVSHLGISYYLSPLLVIPVTAVISVGFGLLIYRRLRKFGVGPTFVGAVSLLLIVQSSLAAVFGERSITFTSPLRPAVLELGGINIYSQKLLVIGVAGPMMFALWYFLKRTRWGKTLRASAQNWEATALAGVNPVAVSALAFALAGSLSGFAGALTAPVHPFTPFTGRLLILKAFAISRLGMGSIPIALLASFGVGMSETLAGAYLFGEFSDLIPFILLVGFMLLKPKVLGPKEKGEKYWGYKYSDISLAISRPKLKVFYGLLAAFFFALPFFLMGNSFFMHLLIMAGIFALVVSGLDLSYGFTGLPSLAQGAFFGIGAYCSALVSLELGWPAWAGVGLALVVSGCIGALVGQIGMISGKRWTVFTLIITLITSILFVNLDSLTGGPDGLAGIPFLTLGLPGIGKMEINPFLAKAEYYWIVLGLLCMVLVIKSRIINSWLGQSFTAIREDTTLAQSVGIPSRLFKIVSFTFGAVIAGLGGALFAHYATYISPGLFDFVTSFRFLMMNRIGGLAGIVGPLVGPLAVTVLDELVRPFNGYVAQIITSLLLILILLYLPGGLTGGVKRLVRLIRGKASPEVSEERARSKGRIQNDLSHEHTEDN